LKPNDFLPHPKYIRPMSGRWLGPIHTGVSKMAITQSRIFDLLHEIEALKVQLTKIREELQKSYQVDQNGFTGFLLSMCNPLDTPAYHTEKAHFKAVAKINNRQTMLKRKKRGTLESKPLTALPTLESKPLNVFPISPEHYNPADLPKALQKISTLAAEIPYEEISRLRETNLSLIKTHNPTWSDTAVFDHAYELARQGKTYEHPEDVTGNKIEGRFFQ